MIKGKIGIFQVELMRPGSSKLSLGHPRVPQGYEGIPIPYGTCGWGLLTRDFPIHVVHAGSLTARLRYICNYLKGNFQFELKHRSLTCEFDRQKLRC